MSKRTIRLALTLAGTAVVLAGGLPAAAQAAVPADPAPVVTAGAVGAAAVGREAQRPSMLGRWHYVAGPGGGALAPGQDWLIDVTQAADGTLVGTIATSSHTSGPCVVGGIQWRGITELGLGRWTGEQSMCDGTFVPTTFTASESGAIFQRTSDNTDWTLHPVTVAAG